MKNAVCKRACTLLVAGLVAWMPVQQSAYAATVLEGTATHQVFNGGGGTTTVINASELNNTSLNVAPNTQLVVDFGNSPTVSLSGNLINSGNIFAISTNPSVNTATISAQNIQNGQNAMISTVLPQSVLSQLSGTVSNLNLVLNAIENVVNAGKITSAGSLSVFAGGSITNALPAGITGVNPVMQAMGNLNLISPVVNNAGLIESVTANINVINQTVSQLTSQIASNLTIANLGGTFSAAGTINIGDAAFGGNQSIDFRGGNILAQVMNLNAGTGTANLHVNDITALLNVNACEAHVSSATNNLQLGAINLSGDPTFYNAAGDISLSADLVFNDNLSIIASGNIVATKAGVDIQTNGGDILMVAGANFTPGSGSASNDSATTLTLTNSALSTGGSTTGGMIDLVGNNKDITSLSSSPIGANADGGNITLVAYAGSDSGSGTVTLPSAVTVTSGGTGSGQNGDVLIIAGEDGGNKPSISTGAIDTTGGSGSGGQITIATTTPVVSGGTTCAPCILILNGAVTNGGQFIVDLNKLQTASVETGALTAAKNVTVNAGLNIDLAGSILSGDSIVITARDGELDIFNATQLIAAQDITLTAGRDVRLNKTSNNTVDSVQVIAGSLNPGADLTKTLSSSDILVPGTITITSTGRDILMGRDVDLVANGGDVQMKSAGMIDVQSDGIISSYGGYVTMNAGTSIQVHHNTCITSVAAYLSGTTGAFTGGGIAMYTEQPSTDLVVELQNVQAQQPGIGDGDVNAHLIQSPEFTRLNGGYINVNEDGVDHIDITDSVFLADGGVILLETGNGLAPSNKIQIMDQCCITAIAPGSTPPGPPVDPPGPPVDPPGPPVDPPGPPVDPPGPPVDPPGPPVDPPGPPVDPPGPPVDPPGPPVDPPGPPVGGGPGSGGPGPVTPPPGPPAPPPGPPAPPPGPPVIGPPTTLPPFPPVTPPILPPPGLPPATGLPPITPGTPTPPTLVAKTTDTTSQLPPTDLIGRNQPQSKKGEQCTPSLIAQRNSKEYGQFWMVAVDAGQPYAIPGDEEAVVLAKPGTRFVSNEQGEITMRDGNLLIAAGAHPISVFVPMGKVVVPAYSTASIEQGRFGEARVASLEGSSTKIAVQKHGQTTEVAINFGKQMAFADSAIASAGTSDFVQGPKPGAIAGVATSENDLNDPETAKRLTQLMDCRIGCMSTPMKKRFKSLVLSASKAGKGIGQQTPPEIGAVRSPLKPVAYTTRTSAPALRTLITETGVLKCMPDAVVFDSENGILHLSRGTAVVRANKPTMVMAGDYAVRMGRGSIAELTTNESLLKVRNLKETSAHSVSVTVEGKRLDAYAGREIIIARSDRELMTHLQHDAVGRRAMKTHDLQKFSVSGADYSIPTILAHGKVLRAIIHSKNAEDKEISDDIIKMAAILSYVMRDRGPYKMMQAPKQ